MEQPHTQSLSPEAYRHATTPCHYGTPGRFDGHAVITGPCGDTMEFWLLVENSKIAEARFVTDGCGSSLACGSITTCLATGRSLAEAMAIGQADVLEALDGLPDEWAHCALLASNTLRAACQDYFERHPHDQDEGARARRAT